MNQSVSNSVVMSFADVYCSHNWSNFHEVWAGPCDYINSFAQFSLINFQIFSEQKGCSIWTQFLDVPCSQLIPGLNFIKDFFKFYHGIAY